MSQQEGTRPDDGAGLTAEELAGELGTPLPDREAMSLITGPGGAGPLPVLAGPPLGTFTPAPSGEVIEPGPGEPLPVAEDVGSAS